MRSADWFDQLIQRVRLRQQPTRHGLVDDRVERRPKKALPAPQSAVSAPSRQSVSVPLSDSAGESHGQSVRDTRGVHDRPAVRAVTDDATE